MAEVEQMGIEWDWTIGVLDLAQCIVTVFLALVVAWVGWRFSNVRAGRDLFLEEAAQTRKTCADIRVGLLGSTPGKLRPADFFSSLDELGRNLDNCRKVLQGSRKGRRLAREINLQQSLLCLRKTISLSELGGSQVVTDGVARLKEIEESVIELTVRLNK